MCNTSGHTYVCKVTVTMCCACFETEHIAHIAAPVSDAKNLSVRVFAVVGFTPAPTAALHRSSIDCCLPKLHPKQCMPRLCTSVHVVLSKQGCAGSLPHNSRHSQQPLQGSLPLQHQWRHSSTSWTHTMNPWLRLLRMERSSRKLCVCAMHNVMSVLTSCKAGQIRMRKGSPAPNVLHQHMSLYGCSLENACQAVLPVTCCCQFDVRTADCSKSDPDCIICQVYNLAI